MLNLNIEILLKSLKSSITVLFVMLTLKKAVFTVEWMKFLPVTTKTELKTSTLMSSTKIVEESFYAAEFFNIFRLRI